VNSCRRWRQQAQVTAAAVIEAKNEVMERKRELDLTKERMDRLVDKLYAGREKGLELQGSIAAAQVGNKADTGKGSRQEAWIGLGYDPGPDTISQAMMQCTHLPFLAPNQHTRYCRCRYCRMLPPLITTHFSKHLFPSTCTCAWLMYSSFSPQLKDGHKPPD